MSDKFVCGLCDKNFSYVTSLKNHLQTLHSNIVGDETGSKWEEYCKVIKGSPESFISLKDLPTMPRPRIRSYKAPKKNQLIGAQIISIDPNAKVKEEANINICTSKCDNSSHIHTSKRIDDKVINLSLPITPKSPLKSTDHNHVHSEFCGDSMIVHGNHIDYIHDAELHFVGQSGIVYPHKLEISVTNPTGCKPKSQYPWIPGHPRDMCEEEKCVI